MHMGTMVFTTTNPFEYTDSTKKSCSLINEIMFPFMRYNLDELDEEERKKAEDEIEKGKWIYFMDYYTLGGAWNNIFKEELIDETNRFNDSIEGCINIKDYDMNFIEEKLNKRCYYAIFEDSDEILRKEINNPNYNKDLPYSDSNEYFIDNPEFMPTIKKWLEEHKDEEVWICPLDIHE